jgi:osmotically-inducible protein OsmY
MNSQIVELRSELVKAKIEEALVKLAHEQAKLISVTSGDGAVTLGGTVSSATAERAVLAAAHHVLGTAEVRDDLHVVPFLPDESDPDRPWR